VWTWSSGGKVPSMMPMKRKGDPSWRGSRERNRGPMNKNRMGGGAGRGEWARCQEASMVKARGYVDPAVVRGRKTFLPGEISPEMITSNEPTGRESPVDR
jgi:hypothetical protein